MGGGWTLDRASAHALIVRFTFLVCVGPQLEEQYKSRVAAVKDLKAEKVAMRKVRARGDEWLLLPCRGVVRLWSVMLLRCWLVCRHPLPRPFLMAC